MQLIIQWRQNPHIYCTARHSATTTSLRYGWKSTTNVKEKLQYIHINCSAAPDQARPVCVEVVSDRNASLVPPKWNFCWGRRHAPGKGFIGSKLELALRGFTCRTSSGKAFCSLWSSATCVRTTLSCDEAGCEGLDSMGREVLWRELTCCGWTRCAPGSSPPCTCGRTRARSPPPLAPWWHDACTCSLPSHPFCRIHRDKHLRTVTKAINTQHARTCR